MGRTSREQRERRAGTMPAQDTPHLLGLTPRSITVVPATAAQLAGQRAAWAQYRRVAAERGVPVIYVATIAHLSEALLRCTADDELVRTIGEQLAGALHKPVPADDPVTFYRQLATNTYGFVFAERPEAVA